MKMQKYVILIKQNSKIIILKHKKYFKARHHCHYSGEYKGAVHSTCKLKYSVPKTTSVVFQNGKKL